MTNKEWLQNKISSFIDKWIIAILVASWILSLTFFILSIITDFIWITLFIPSSCITVAITSTVVDDWFEQEHEEKNKKS